MASNLSRVLFVAGLMIAAGCQSAPVSDGDAAAAPGSISRKSLPPDGSWVRYAVNHESKSHPYQKRSKSDANTESIVVKRWSEKITLSFAGSTAENGVPCRWVEVRRERPDPPPNKPCAYKMLLKEDGLLKDKDPLDGANVLRVWQQMPDGTVSRRDEAPDYGDLFSWTPGVVRRFKPSGERRDIDCASGHLSSAAAYTREATTNSHIGLGVIRFHVEQRATVWLHPDLPVGFAAMRTEQDVTARFMMKPATTSEVTEYVLEDAGTDAQTSLPDHN